MTGKEMAPQALQRLKGQGCVIENTQSQVYLPAGGSVDTGSRPLIANRTGDINVPPLLVAPIPDAGIVTILLGSTDPSGDTPAAASKRFTADGKKASCQPAHFIGVQVFAPTAVELAAVVALVAKRPDAALCIGGFLGQRTFKLAEVLAAAQGRKLRDAILEIGFHVAPRDSLPRLPQDGRYVARVKETTYCPGWLLLDRDIDEHTPKPWASISAATWISKLNEVIPGLAQAPRIDLPSASARVLKDGEPVGRGSGHSLVQCLPMTHDQISAARAAVRGCFVVSGLSWTRTASNGAALQRYPVDLATWTSCSMDYCGRPQVDEGCGLEVIDADIRIVNHDGPPLDLARITPPSHDALLAAERALRPGVKITMSGSGARSQLDVYDLRPEMQVELASGEILTLAEVHARLLAMRNGGQGATAGRASQPRIRMQSPLRPESRSVAAFATLTEDGGLVLIDSGLPGEVHHYDPAHHFSTVPSSPPGLPVGGATPAVRPGGRFRVVPASEFTLVRPMQWWVKRVIPKAALVLIIGASGSGKTTLLGDIVMSVALGQDWRGHRVRQGRIVVIAAEDAQGWELRLQALATARGVDIGPLPLGVVPAAPNLFAGDEAAVAQAISDAGGADMVIIDTLAQSAAGTDENASKDMGLVLAACRRIHEATGATIVVCHHTGKDASKGARGWSGLKAAADAEVTVTRNGDDRLAEVTKQKNGRDGARFGFRLHVVKLGVDEDLDPIESCVIEHIDAPAHAVREKPLTGAARISLNTLRVAIDSEGFDLPASAGEVFGRRAIHVDRWRELAYGAGISDSTEDSARRKAFARARQILLDRRLIGVANDHYWIEG